MPPIDEAFLMAKPLIKLILVPLPSTFHVRSPQMRAANLSCRITTLAECEREPALHIQASVGVEWGPTCLRHERQSVALA
jgi:hypothetical protein